LHLFKFFKRELDILSKDINVINVSEIYEVLEHLDAIFEFFSKNESRIRKFREDVDLIKDSFSFILVNLHKQISLSILEKKLGMVLINDFKNLNNFVFDLIEKESEDLSFNFPHLQNHLQDFNSLIDYFCNINVFEEVKRILLEIDDDFFQGEFNEDLEQNIEDRILNVLGNILHENAGHLQGRLNSFARFFSEMEAEDFFEGHNREIIDYFKSIISSREFLLKIFRNPRL